MCPLTEKFEGYPCPAQGKPAVPTDMGALLYNAFSSFPFHAKVGG